MDCSEGGDFAFLSLAEEAEIPSKKNKRTNKQMHKQTHTCY